MVSRQETDLTRTPGSTVSDEMPPLPPVSMIADRYSERGRSADDMSSDGGSDGSIRMEDINSPSVPRKLRRAGDDDGSRSPERPRNAFDALKLGQMKHRYGQDKEKKQRAKKSDFIAEEVEESEDEGEYSMLRKIHEEGDEEDGSDLDATVEELVDDEKGDPDEEEAQDEIVDEHHRDWIAQQEAKELKMAAKVAAGKTKKRRRGDDGGLSDSDYEDDAMHRTAKARKAKKYSTKMEALSTLRQLSLGRLIHADTVVSFEQPPIPKPSLSPKRAWMMGQPTSTAISWRLLIQPPRQRQTRNMLRNLRICHPIGHRVGI